MVEEVKFPSPDGVKVVVVCVRYPSGFIPSSPDGGARCYWQPLSEPPKGELSSPGGVQGVTGLPTAASRRKEKFPSPYGV